MSLNEKLGNIFERTSLVRFSVIVPTYGRCHNVKDCMTHTISNCGILRERIELIHVDDGSPDNRVHNVMREFSPDITILKKHNTGTMKTKNIGMVVATSDWICIIDSDFKMSNDWLKILESYIVAIPELKVVCFSNHNQLGWGSKEIIHINKLPFQKMRNNLISGAFAFSRDVLNDVGYLDEDFGFYGHGDAEFTCRLAKAGYLFGYIPSIIGEHTGGTGAEGENRRKKDESLQKHKHLLNKKVKSPRLFYSPYISKECNEVYDKYVRNKLGKD